jgi:hypothetical protein
MLTLEVVKTIKWIDSLIPENVRDVFLCSDIFHGKLAIEEIGQKAIIATYELGRIAGIINKNPIAVEVLTAFDATNLLNTDITTSLLIQILQQREITASTRQILSEIAAPYNRMVNSVFPWESLTTPKELMGEEPPENIITLHIYSLPKKSSLISTLSTTTAQLNDLYMSIAHIYNKKVEESLSIVKIESGLGIRMDCKGSEDVIRHLKAFILEAWHKIRHKRAEEVVENNKALLSSLAVIDTINQREMQKSLSPEESEQLRRKIIKNVLGLFQYGALISEIPQEETVDNTKLLSAFSSKLLEAPVQVKDKTKKVSSKKTTAKKKVSTKKTVKKKK